MSANRQGNGQFGPGNRANPSGRRRKDCSAKATILREMNASVIITENKKRKSISKLAANAKQVANKGASGDIRAAKLAIDYALKAERESEGPPALPTIVLSDMEIVKRFLARLSCTSDEEAENASEL